MTTPLRPSSFSEYGAHYNVTVINDHSSEAPPYALLEVTGASTYGTDTVFTVTRPTTGTGRKFLVNGPQTILAGGYGSATDQFPTDIAYDTGASPVVNAEWGPVTTSWLLTSTGTGFRILGGPSDGVVRVASIAASSGSENYRLVRGKAKGTVTADDATFPVDNVLVLGGGLDPRMTPDDAAEELTVVNVHKQAFKDNEDLTAIYREGNATWEVFIGERYRLIRGRAVGAVSGSGTFTIDNVEVLADGLDPRTDPTDAAETVTVDNFHTDSYADNAWVIAIYNNGTWEALPKETTTSGHIIVKISGQISARSGTTRGSGTAQPVDSSTLANDGGTITVYNLSGNTYEGGVSGGPLYCVAHYVDGEYFIDPTDLRSISSFANNYYLGAQSGLPNWRAFSTDSIDGTAECVDGVITITISPDTFVVAPS